MTLPGLNGFCSSTFSGFRKMLAVVPQRLRRRSFLHAEYLGLVPFPSGALPAEISLAPAYPGYFLVRRAFVRRILAHRRDENRQPFIVQYDIRRENRGPRRRHRFAKRPLLPYPCFNRRGRWQLEVQFNIGKRNKRTPYHRLVSLACCPCTTDSEGYEVDPFFVQLGGLTHGLYDGFWEAHHGNGDTRDNTAANLFTLWWEVHRQLPRGTT